MNVRIVRMMEMKILLFGISNIGKTSIGKILA